MPIFPGKLSIDGEDARLDNILLATGDDRGARKIDAAVAYLRGHGFQSGDLILASGRRVAIGNTPVILFTRVMKVKQRAGRQYRTLPRLRQVQRISVRVSAPAIRRSMRTELLIAGHGVAGVAAPVFSLPGVLGMAGPRRYWCPKGRHTANPPPGVSCTRHPDSIVTLV